MRAIARRRRGAAVFLRLGDDDFLRRFDATVTLLRLIGDFLRTTARRLDFRRRTLTVAVPELARTGLRALRRLFRAAERRDIEARRLSASNEGGSAGPYCDGFLRRPRFTLRTPRIIALRAFIIFRKARICPGVPAHFLRIVVYAFFGVF